MKKKIDSNVGLRVYEELVTAKEFLDSVCPAVSIYGGARVKEDNPYYQKTRELARALSDVGFAVISGGGPGIMRAANHGASEGRTGLSIGLNIKLPFEQQANPYQDISLEFAHFAARKIAFCKYSKAFVVMPGGVGTLDELFEVLTLIQTHKMPAIPVILFGREFWQGLLSWMEHTLLARGFISSADLHERIQVADTTQEVLHLLEEANAHVCETEEVPA